MKPSPSNEFFNDLFLRRSSEPLRLKQFIFCTTDECALTDLALFIFFSFCSLYLEEEKCTMGIVWGILKGYYNMTQQLRYLTERGQ